MKRKIPMSNVVLCLRRAGISIGQLAKSLGISRQAIYRWQRVPAERVPEVARLTGITPNILRRDLYGRMRKRN